MGADDFLPAIILCVLHANSPTLPSDIAYVNAYADPGSLRGEEGYVLTHFYSAVEFLRGAGEEVRRKRGRPFFGAV